MTVCAVDIGGTWTKLGVVDQLGVVSQFERLPTAGPWERFLAQLQARIEALRADSIVSSVGVSVAGFLDAARAAMAYNPNLPWLEGRPLRSALQDSLGLPVHLEVDSNAAALGEYHWGSGAGADRFLCLVIGTGIGGGFMACGEVVRFTGECLGDLGHVIVEPNGRRCTCGGRGCAEAVASAPAIIAASGTAATLEDLASKPEAAALFRNAGKNIGLLAASLASIFFPDRIALGGGVAESSALVIEAARESFLAAASDVARRGTQLMPAKLGSQAALVGAALIGHGRQE